MLDKNKIWLDNYCLENEDVKDWLKKKFKFYNIDYKIILLYGFDGLSIKIRNSVYIIEVSRDYYKLRVLQRNKIRNRSGHDAHYVKNLEFDGNTCWDDLLSWILRKMK